MVFIYIEGDYCVTFSDRIARYYVCAVNIAELYPIFVEVVDGVA